MKELDDLLSKIDKLSGKEKRDALEEAKSALKEAEQRTEAYSSDNENNKVEDENTIILKELIKTLDSDTKELEDSDDYISALGLFFDMINHKKDVSNIRREYSNKVVRNLRFFNSNLPFKNFFIDAVDLENRIVRIGFFNSSDDWIEIQEIDGDISIVNSKTGIHNNQATYNFSNFKIIFKNLDQLVDSFVYDFEDELLKIQSVNTPFRLEIDSDYTIHIMLEDKEAVALEVKDKWIDFKTLSDSWYTYMFVNRRAVLKNIHINVHDLPIMWQKEIKKRREEEAVEKPKSLFG